MKTQLTLVLLAVIAAVMLSSCEKETFETANSQTGSLNDNNGVPLGTVEVLNSENSIYLVITMSTNYFLENISANFGTTADIPANNGIMVLEDFMYLDHIDGGANNYTVIYPNNSLPVCNDIVLNAAVSQRNWFGQTISTQTCWLGTNDIYDGYFFKYCQEVCN